MVGASDKRRSRNRGGKGGVPRERLASEFGQITGHTKWENEKGPYFE